MTPADQTSEAGTCCEFRTSGAIYLQKLATHNCCWISKHHTGTERQQLLGMRAMLTVISSIAIIMQDVTLGGCYMMLPKMPCHVSAHQCMWAVMHMRKDAVPDYMSLQLECCANGIDEQLAMHNRMPGMPVAGL